MARAYYFGEGLEPDRSKGVHLWEQLAIGGHARARCALAYCYIDEAGVPGNLEKAIRWFREAAEQGFSRGTISSRSLLFRW